MNPALFTKREARAAGPVRGALLTRQGFLSRWRTEGERLRRIGALVEPAKLLDEILGDAEALFDAEDNELLTLTEAADESGYSADHLGRLIRDNVIPNAGRKNAPKIRRADLPRKAAAQLPRTRAGAKFVGATPTQIARAVVANRKGTP